VPGRPDKAQQPPGVLLRVRPQCLACLTACLHGCACLPACLRAALLGRLPGAYPVSACRRTLTRSRRNSLSSNSGSEASEDGCAMECSTSGRPSFMARLTRRAPRATLRRTSACASEDSAPCSSEYSSSSALKPAGSDMDAEADSGEEALNERVGYLLRGSPVRVVAPDEFLDPVTDCLILEPVTLLNTNTTVDRLTLQEWLRAGERPARVPLALCLCCLCCLGRAVACSPATCASCHQAASCLS